MKEWKKTTIINNGGRDMQLLSQLILSFLVGGCCSVLFFVTSYRRTSQNNIQTVLIGFLMYFIFGGTINLIVSGLFLLNSQLNKVMLVSIIIGLFSGMTYYALKSKSSN